MLLGNFIKDINRKYYKTYFSGVAFNSKQVKKNNIFFAIEGTKFDGNKYIFDAINNGAKIIISKKNIKFRDKSIIFLRDDNPRKLLAEISFKLIKKKPTNLIAVTGTNGKSSIANFYYQILNLNNKKAATIGTLGVRSKEINFDLSNTTIDQLIKMSQAADIETETRVELLELAVANRPQGQRLAKMLMQAKKAMND